MNRIVAGALAGFVATIPMTQAMELMYRRLPPDQRFPLPPHGITSNLLRKLEVEQKWSPDAIRRLTHALHFGFGALAGALYPLIRRPPQSLTTEVVEGAMYGVGVWAASYLGWVPASGLLGSALRQTRSRVRLMVLAHLVWGPATALLARQLESTRRGSSRFGSL